MKIPFAVDRPRFMRLAWARSKQQKIINVTSQKVFSVLFIYLPKNSTTVKSKTKKAENDFILNRFTV